MKHLIRVRQADVLRGEAVRGGRVGIVPGDYYVDLTTFQFSWDQGEEPALLFHDSNVRDGGGDLMVRLADYPELLAHYPAISGPAVEVASKVI